MKRLAALVAAFACIASVAHAGLDRGGALQVVLLRIQGHVGAARPGDRGVASLTLRRDRDTIAFQVDEIWVLSGDLVGLDVLHEVEPYKPNMTVDGPSALLDRLEQASPAEPLEVTGYFRRGARMLMLSSVEPLKTK
jgi:hypothetical protein